MKTFLLILSIFGSFSIAFGQTIDDNKIQFGYTQLPYIKIDAMFTNYAVNFVPGLSRCASYTKKAK